MVDQVSFAEIQRCIGAGDHAGAEAVCRRIESREDGSAGFWQMRGTIACIAKDWSGAEAYFSRALALVPEAAEPWLGLARVHAGNNRALAAGIAAERAIAAGLRADDRLAAQQIVAHAKFSNGDLAGGRAELAALAPAYKAKLADPATQRDALSGALSSALCSGDAPLLEQTIRLMYPHAAADTPMTVAPLSTLETWCRDAGVPCALVEAPRKVHCDATSPYSRAYTYTTDPILFAGIPGGKWVPGWDFVLGADGTVLEDTGYLNIVHVFNHAPHAYFPAAKRVGHRAPILQDVDEDVLLMSAPMHNHVGHWLVDFLPRLIGRRYAPGVKLAVPDDLRGGKFRDTLALAGLDESHLFRCRRDRQYRFRTLHVYRAGRSHPPHPAHVHFVRDLLNPEGPRRRRKGKRVFLARSSVGTRLAVNAEAFARLLAEHDFISAELENLTIAQQRDLIGDADVLLGAFGSNLFGMYFAPPGCTLIAMQWDHEIDPIMPHTCAALGLAHQFLLCRSTQKSHNARNWIDLDFTVDCAELRRRLAEIDAA